MTRCLLFDQQAATVQAVKLVRRDAHCVHTGEHQLGLPHGLRRVHMEAAVGIVSQNIRDLLDRLHRAELAVHRADGDKHRVLSQKLAQVFQINGAVPPDVHEVDLAALLLERGQRTAHGGMLQCRGDDVLSHMAGRLHDALERKVVGFARAGGVDRSPRALRPEVPRCRPSPGPFPPALPALRGGWNWSFRYSAAQFDKTRPAR